MALLSFLWNCILFYILVVVIKEVVCAAITCYKERNEITH